MKLEQLRNYISKKLNQMLRSLNQATSLIDNALHQILCTDDIDAMRENLTLVSKFDNVVNVSHQYIP